MAAQFIPISTWLVIATALTHTGLAGMSARLSVSGHVSYDYSEWVAMGLCLLWTYLAVGAFMLWTRETRPYLVWAAAGIVSTVLLVQITLDIYNEFAILGRFVFLFMPVAKAFGCGD